MKKRLLSIALAVVMIFTVLPISARADGSDIGMRLLDSGESYTEMTTSQSMVDMIKDMEGFSAEPYWDVNQWSIGYGSCCGTDKSEKPDLTVTEEEAEAMLAPVIADVRAALGDLVYGVDVSSLEEVCFRLLKERGLTFATAESCTGGRVAERITALSGASAVYRGGVVSYWSEVKRDVLGVPWEIIEQHGAVSEPCARAMAEGARAITGADLGVSVTGVAGPDSDERGNPVGRVFIALATPSGTYCRHIEAGRRRRDRIQIIASHHAFDLIRRYLTDLPIE